MAVAMKRNKRKLEMYNQEQEEEQDEQAGEIQHEDQLEARSTEAVIQQLEQKIRTYEGVIAELVTRGFKDKEERKNGICKLKRNHENVEKRRLKEKEDSDNKILELKQKLKDVSEEKEQYENEIETLKKEVKDKDKIISLLQEKSDLKQPAVTKTPKQNTKQVPQVEQARPKEQQVAMQGKTNKVANATKQIEHEREICID